MTMSRSDAAKVAALPDNLRARIASPMDASQCWLWIGHITPAGYGRVAVSRRGSPVLAHRLVYQTLVGPIPEGMSLDHLCRVRHCVNPAHLEPVTTRENALRSPLLRPAVCKRGHAMEGDNLMFRAHEGRYRCRACDNLRQREGRRRRGEVVAR